MKEEETKPSCLKNGKLTGLVIVITLAFAMAVFMTGLFLITYFNGTTDNNFKDPIGKLIYGSGAYIIVNGASALIHRGGNFVKELFKTGKGK